jgi:hypothetical protein
MFLNRSEAYRYFEYTCEDYFEEVDVCSNCESWEVGHLKLVNPNSDVYDFDIDYSFSWCKNCEDIGYNDIKRIPYKEFKEEQYPYEKNNMEDLLNLKRFLPKLEKDYIMLRTDEFIKQHNKWNAHEE